MSIFKYAATQRFEGREFFNTSAHCANYAARTSTEDEQLLIYWIAHEFNLPADLRMHLQYTKLEILSNDEFWKRIDVGVSTTIELNDRNYLVHYQSQSLILRTAPWIAVSYRQYCGMRYAVAHVWNAKPDSGEALVCDLPV